jgi:metal-responsive CopG/Arc/MetJ family transcriptional regulator
MVEGRMKRVSVVLDSKLLKDLELAASRQRVSRSTVVADALRAYLERREEFDERERLGYLAQPQREDEYLPWVEVAAWPEE